MLKKILLFSLVSLLWCSCYYNNYEKLQPSQSNLCDTTNVSYLNVIHPIMQNYCVGCHNPVTPNANILVNSHSNLTAAVATGRFTGAINHTSGYAPMPMGGAKLSDCYLLQIQAWINQGMKNN